MKRVPIILIIFMQIGFSACSIKDQADTSSDEVTGTSSLRVISSNDLDGDKLIKEFDSEPNRGNFPSFDLSISKMKLFSINYIDGDKFYEYLLTSIDEQFSERSLLLHLNQTKNFKNNKQEFLSLASNIANDGFIFNLFDAEGIVKNREHLFKNAVEPNFKDQSGIMQFDLKLNVNNLTDYDELLDITFELSILDQKLNKSVVQQFSMSSFSGGSINNKTGEIIIPVSLKELKASIILNSMLSVGSKMLIEIKDYKLRRNKETYTYKELSQSIRNNCLEIIVSTADESERHYLVAQKESLSTHLKNIYKDELSILNGKIARFKGLSSNMQIPNSWSDLADNQSGSWVVSSNKLSTSLESLVGAGDTVQLSFIQASEVLDLISQKELFLYPDFTGELSLWKIFNGRTPKKLNLYYRAISESGYSFKSATLLSSFGSGTGKKPWKGQFLSPFKNSNENEINSSLAENFKVYSSQGLDDSSSYEISFDRDSVIQSREVALNESKEQLKVSNLFESSSSWQGMRYFNGNDFLNPAMARRLGGVFSMSPEQAQSFKQQKINLYIYAQF